MLALGLLAFGWVLAAGPSEAQSGSMHNCLPGGKSSIAVWEGESSAAADYALATCGAGTVAGAYFLDPQTGGSSRWFDGKPLCEHQLVQKMLFDMFTKVEAAGRLSRAAFVYNGNTFPPALQYSIAAKVFCTQTAFEVASDAVQLFGGMGLCKELLVRSFSAMLAP